MIVMKFGGTSVANSAAIRLATDIVHSRLGQQPVVVVSALAGITDSLLLMSQHAASGSLPDALELLHVIRQRHLDVLPAVVSDADEASLREQIQQATDQLQDMLRGIATLGELSTRTTDSILATGELLSSAIVAAALRMRGIEAVLLDSRRCLVTDANHTCAVLEFDETADRLHLALVPLLHAHQVAVMGGFIAATAAGVTTTLGRGGSDLSAAIIGAALNASRIEIWTDVEGMMTTDPRLCSRAQRIDAIGFDEASELAYFGAKVLHPATLIPAIAKNIPVYVLNSQQPENKGTRICANVAHNVTALRAIAAKRGMQVVNVRSAKMLKAHGFMRTLFEIFDRHECVADLVSTSEVSASVALDSSRNISALLRDLRMLGEVEVQNRKAIICLVGKQIRGRAGFAAKVFNTVAKAGINIHMISQGASEINISFVVEESDVREAVQRLHECFFESECLMQPASAATSWQTPSSSSHADARAEVG